MTSRTRAREAVAKPRAVFKPQGVGHGLHKVDGDWGKARTIFDSVLLRGDKECYGWLEIIDWQIAHADAIPREHDDGSGVTLDEILATITFTTRQREAVENRAAGLSLSQVAAEMGIKKASVQTHLGRAHIKYLASGPQPSYGSVVSNEGDIQP